MVTQDKLYEYSNTGDIQFQSIYGNIMFAQYFTTPQELSHIVSSVRLKLFKIGTVTNMEYMVSIWSTTTSGEGYAPVSQLTGVTLDADALGASQSGDWVKVKFPPSFMYVLSSGTTYAVVVSMVNGTGDSNDCIGWRDAVIEFGIGGAKSTNGGTSWSATSNTLMFEIWGITTSQPPNESRDSRTYEDFRVERHYSSEEDVYDAIGQQAATVQNIVSMDADAVSSKVNKFIHQADERIRRLMGIPITVRKEGHEFFNNPTIQLGPDREDPFEVWGDYDPSDKVEDIYAIYYNEYRVKIPYPKDMDQFTEPDALPLWSLSGGGTINADFEDFKCGVASICVNIAGAGSATYPSTQNMHKRIYPWFYMGMMFKCTDPTANFQIQIVRSTGSYYYTTFNASNPNTWEPIMFSIRRFQFNNVGGEGPQPDFNWILTYTEYIRITVDRACTFWIDNLNFNDGFFATFPEGTIQWCMPEWYPTGRITVTYSFDPFKNDIPEALQEASAKLAGVLTLDWLIGFRQSKIAFDEMSDTLSESPDRETLENTRRRIEVEAMEALATLGFKGYAGVG